MIADLNVLEAALLAGLRAVLVDSCAPGARDAAELGIQHGCAVVAIVDDPQCGGELLEVADAALLRDRIDQATLTLALAAIDAGYRVTARELPLRRTALTGPPEGTDLDARTLEALALIAGGARDADIAAELFLSESAARKLVHRAVHQLGARTRCEAVVRAIAIGLLPMPRP